jgi:predicted extracellular nuclease
VTEFYGLTELDNNDLYISIESRNNPLPEPIEIDPPAGNEESADYLERFEAMRVSLPISSVVGPAHIGCGFNVVRADTGLVRVLVREAGDPAGQIVGVLHRSDVNCDTMPGVAQGDEVVGLVGPLTYHFDRFKIVYQDPAQLSVWQREHAPPAGSPEVPPGGFVIATFNVNNYFDKHDDTGENAEPKPTEIEVTLKTSKVAATISDRLGCPALVGLQEVEKSELLRQLVKRLSEPCGFEYEISHLDSPDARGAEQALMSDPGRVEVHRVSLIQACSELDTGVVDSEAICEAGQQPLYSRPPLQVEASIDGRRLVILVNHFKSKRDGAELTAPRRLAQARHVNQIVKETQAAEPDSFLIVLGDFNDYDGSEVMKTLLAGTQLVDALAELPNDHRYSYIFDGASQLIDWILLSPALTEFMVEGAILHNNADFPFRMGDLGDRANLSYGSSDHDVPYLVLDFKPEEGPALILTSPPPNSAPSSAAQILPEQSPTDAPLSMPISAEQGETRPADEPSETIEAPLNSESVEVQSFAEPNAIDPGVITVWIFVLAALAAIFGAIVIRNRR